MMVWLLHIRQQHGHSTWVYSTEALARRRLAAYARDWWEHEGVEGDPSTKEDADAVEAYFYRVRGRESFALEGVTVDED